MVLHLSISLSLCVLLMFRLDKGSGLLSLIA
jgi:hypothetical protein